MDHVKALQSTDKTETGVRFTRWYMDVDPPPFYAAINFPGKINRWQEMEFISPGTIVLYSGGVDASRGQDRSDHSHGVHGRYLMALTPCDKDNCMVFYSSTRAFLRDVSAVTEKMFNDFTKILTEDASIVEAQHLNLVKYPDRPLTNIASDAARVLAQRHLDAQKMDC